MAVSVSDVGCLLTGYGNIEIRIIIIIIILILMVKLTDADR